MPLSPGADPDVFIYYDCHTFGLEEQDREKELGAVASHRILLVAGVGCAQDVWTNEIKVMESHCLKGEVPLKGRVSVCSFDNRGIGRSTSPVDRNDYTIEKMAEDCLALMKHLQWNSAHIVGHSMGSMISTRIALLAPERVDSLTLVATCRRFADLWPRSFRSIGLFFNMLFSPLDLEGRALMDLKCHFTQDYLDEELHVQGTDSNGAGELSQVRVDVLPTEEDSTRSEDGDASFVQQPLTRRDSLKQEYMRKASIKHNHQPDHGFKGQMNACRCHFVSMREIEALRETSFPFVMIHGTEDYIIPWQAGQKFFLMLKNRSKFMLLHGAHFLSRERVDEVVNAILQQVFEGSNNANKRMKV